MGTEGRKSPLLECAESAKEKFSEAAEFTKELAHQVKEKIDHIDKKDDIDKKVTDAVENFEYLKEQLAEEQNMLRKVQQQKAIHPDESLLQKEIKLKRQELETEAQIEESTAEYKHLRTEQLQNEMQRDQQSKSS